MCHDRWIRRSEDVERRWLRELQERGRDADRPRPAWEPPPGAEREGDRDDERVLVLAGERR